MSLAGRWEDRAHSRVVDLGLRLCERFSFASDMLWKPDMAVPDLHN